MTPRRRLYTAAALLAAAALPSALSPGKPPVRAAAAAPTVEDTGRHTTLLPGWTTTSDGSADDAFRVPARQVRNALTASPRASRAAARRAPTRPPSQSIRAPRERLVDPAPTRRTLPTFPAVPARTEAAARKAVPVRQAGRGVTKKVAGKLGGKAVRRTYKPTGGVQLPALLKRIRSCESGDGRGSYNYRAQNPRSTASGAWQAIDSTWAYVTGLPGKAKHYSRATQDRFALKLFRSEGTRPWASSARCWR